MYVATAREPRDAVRRAEAAGLSVQPVALSPHHPDKRPDRGYELPHACGTMQTLIDNPDVPVAYDPKFREYALNASDWERVLWYCPWCGTRRHRPVS